MDLLEESSGEPISYKYISRKTSLGAATNRGGYFVISDFGSYTLNASMIGYGIFKKEITINDSGSIRLTIFLIGRSLKHQNHCYSRKTKI